MTNNRDNEQREITVSLDRLKLTLERYRSRKSIMTEIFSYLGTLLTLLITVCTAQYNDFWIFSANMVEGIFIAMLIVVAIFFFIRVFYLFFVRKGICDDESFINSLEYKTNEKPYQATHKKLAIIINISIFVVLCLIIGIYIGLGFLAKWHWAYDVFVSYITLMGIGMYISYWKDLFRFLYNFFKY